jgi:sugar lactone lactonase YvrE
LRAPRIVKAECAIVADTADEIAEIPIWDEREQALYWIDMLKPAMYRWDFRTKRTTAFGTPELPSAFALRAGGGVLLATRTHVGAFDQRAGRFEPWVRPEPEPAINFLNDARCDRRGRLWIGSGSKSMKAPTGMLHRVTGDRQVATVERGVCLSNALAWSPDDRTMYYGDSTRGTIWAYDFDLDAGTIRNKCPFAAVPAERGVPDGSVCDAEGFVWSCEFDMSERIEKTTGFIVRYDPTGRIERMLEVPTCRPTAVTFGGPDLDILYCVSSRYHMTAAEHARQPASGAVLAIDVGVKGLLEPRFAG